MGNKELTNFIIRAKLNTYAGHGPQSTSSRPSSKDLQYSENGLLYIDTYLGSCNFLGEEAVWKAGIPVWGMNYWGRMLTGEIPEGFSEFLRAALREVTPEAPYRGPDTFISEAFEYYCTWKGNFYDFSGTEGIMNKGKVVYVLDFHGGSIK